MPNCSPLYGVERRTRQFGEEWAGDKACVELASQASWGSISTQVGTIVRLGVQQDISRFGVWFDARTHLRALRLTIRRSAVWETGQCSDMVEGDVYLYGFWLGCTLRKIIFVFDLTNTQKNHRSKLIPWWPRVLPRLKRRGGTALVQISTCTITEEVNRAKSTNTADAAN